MPAAKSLNYDIYSGRVIVIKGKAIVYLGVKIQHPRGLGYRTGRLSG